ncbi:Methylase of polypeptide chain release factors [Halanaeroarchaeum sp. HSR-CO]|uniref:HemK2/MTQ2 family protein methyltransferase n=1 Tax=Halanaeroarchaeum sp. HSR-CO TaxID=2866382 RepID=UPI00217D23B2|nr:HemK2/MTQ2 family protein methyltransferase [Halanaeroarchaeum sp. HSR-CO]UWG48288.1 Methylase of polypeptide chain release factors [Halanaeroarchaeum sp. HSR-CO]
MTDLADRRGIETDYYEPAEDSMLLADVVVADVDASDLVLDVGTGSGYVGARIRDEAGSRVVGSDLNPHACRRAVAAGIEAVRADLVSPFADGVFDVVTFNPPYLPADDDAARDDWVEVALTGGESGRAVIDPFLDAVGRVLAPDGRVYLLVSTLTGIEAVVKRAGQRGFSSVLLDETSFPFETLVVLKLVA